MNKVISVFSTLLIFVSSQSWAYKASDMDLTSFEFSRYVRPQLRSILTEYSSLFLSLNPDLQPLKNELGLYRDLGPALENISTSCPVIDSDTCIDHLQKLVQKLQDHIVSLDKVELIPGEIMTLDQFLIGQSQLERFKLSLISTYLKIDRHLAEYKINNRTTLRSEVLNNWITELEFMLNLTLINMTDEHYQHVLGSYWTDFIRPIQHIVLPKNDIDFFKNNLTELNIRWNELNVVLTKRNLKIPKQALTLLNIMHNRWNNILKVTLKPL